MLRQQSPTLYPNLKCRYCRGNQIKPPSVVRRLVSRRHSCRHSIVDYIGIRNISRNPTRGVGHNRPSLRIFLWLIAISMGKWIQFAIIGIVSVVCSAQIVANFMGKIVSRCSGLGGHDGKRALWSAIPVSQQPGNSRGVIN